MPTGDEAVIPRTLGAGARSRVAFAVLRAFGWRVVLAQPVPRRSVVIFYPHTSNWDFLIGLLAKWTLGIDVRWVGKHSLFKPAPVRKLLMRWGGIPVNRSAPRDLVEQLCAQFDSHGEFVVAIAPEGTRRRTDYWKTGFYRIAVAARVPLGLAFIDLPSRRIGIGAWLPLTGEVDTDLAAIAAFYADKRGWNPDHAGPIRFH